MICFLYIIESSFSIAVKYLEIFGCFPEDGMITKEFVDAVKNLINQQFFDDKGRMKKHYVSVEMVERCRDVMTGNLEQYKLLMYIAPEERMMQPLQPKTVAVLRSDEGDLSKKQQRINRLQPRMLEIMGKILLFRSLLFTSTGLHIDRVIKRSAAILKPALKKLVELEFLFIVERGLLSSKWTPIYVKRFPTTTSTIDQLQFELKLAELNVPELNLQNIRDASCEILLQGKGKISKQLLDLLRRPEYTELNVNIDTLTSRFG